MTKTRTPGGLPVVDDPRTGLRQAAYAREVGAGPQVEGLTLAGRWVHVADLHPGARVQSWRLATYRAKRPTKQRLPPEVVAANAEARKTDTLARRVEQRATARRIAREVGVRAPLEQRVRAWLAAGVEAWAMAEVEGVVAVVIRRAVESVREVTA
jgi:hypothetical protein